MGMFVDRDPGGTVVTAYASEQRPDQEYLADDADPQLDALLRPPPVVLDRLDRLDAELKALQASSAAQGAAKVETP